MAQNLTYLLSEKARLTADIANVTAQLTYAQANASRSIVAGLEERLASSQAALDEINSQISETQSQQSLPTASSGAVVAESAAAKDDNAYTANPGTGPTLIESTGRISPSDVETGTNADTKTITNTQATPPSSPAYENQTEQPDASPGRPTTQEGVGAGSDDSGEATKNGTRSSIDNTFNSGKIIPQANVLDQYASYTYQASLYLMKPEAYKQLIQSKKKTISGSQLLIQSGGAPTGGRNAYFGNDYYFDKIELHSVITGKGSNAAHNVNTVKMTIIEPMGITLIPNLDKAVQAYLGGAQKKKTNFSAAIYLLVIRFYGYDDAGNLVQGGIADGYGAGQQAFVEKYYPISISDIKFKVGNKAVEYDITATAVSQQIASGSARGTIPYNVEMGGMTVKEALTGPTTVTPNTTSATTNTTATSRTVAGAGLVETTREEQGVLNTDSKTAPAPANATSAPTTKETVRQGLMTALNQYQQELVKKGTYTVADTYSIEFTDTALADARIQVKNPEKTQTGSAAPTTAGQALNPAKQSVDLKTRNISAVAGTQIVQFIDQIMKNSTYITDQALVTRSEQGKGGQVPNGKPGDNVASYKINMVATPKKYDPKRNDYAYDVKYVISPYKVTGLISNYYQVPKFNGVHKQYNYWFTGENTQVLSYEQTYNALYTSVLSGGPGQFGGAVVQDAIKANFQPRSGESSQGAKNAVNEIGANFTDALYNPGDLATAQLTVIGDPAWLQQGDVFPITANNFNPNPFLPDGTINSDSQQVLFEILINTPSDYNLNTGLIDPNVRNTIFQNGKRPGATRQSYIYIANECVSEFNKGKFTQNLKGSLLTYLPDQTFKEQQQLGRPAPAAIENGSRTASTANPNPSIIEDESSRGAPTPAQQEAASADHIEITPDPDSDNTPTSIPAPQPAAPPEPATSDGGIITNPIQSNEVQIAVNTAPQPLPSDPTLVVFGGSVATPSQGRLTEGEVRVYGENSTPQISAKEA